MIGVVFTAIYNEYYLSNELTHRLFVREWTPDGDIKGVVQIAHGMAEHGARYRDFAEFLACRGYAVIINDHRGHGKTRLEDEPRGFFAEADGWKATLRDLLAVGKIAGKHFEGLPLVLMGHSMGSFLASLAACDKRGSIYSAFVLCGTGGPAPAVLPARAIAEAFGAAGKWRAENHLLDRLAFGSYNKRIPKPCFEKAWLTRDDGEVLRYMADPECGFCFTTRGFYDMFTGMSYVRNRTWAKKTHAVPYLLISGAEDPVGDYGKGVIWVRDQLLAANQAVACHLYPEMRHEILNELGRHQVYSDVADWLDEVAVHEQ